MFYIISINTIFLLFVADINIVRVFFNNMINQVIQIEPLQSYLIIWRYDYIFY